jgi:MerR family transcriptional regulator, light-induced transcriptional regulator
MSTHLNIAAIATRTGIAADTLRKWESRYGVLRPARTVGGQRRYSPQDVARVEWLRDRLADGWRIGEAARVLRETEQTAPSAPADLLEALIAETAACRTTAVGGLLEQGFAALPLDDLLEGVVCPLLVWIGEAWEQGDVSVAVEHAVAARVRSHLVSLLADERPAVRGTAVLACGPGEQHDIGLLMVAVSLRADGWAVEYLGASTPVRDALALAQAIGARVVCFGVTFSTSLALLRRELARLEEPQLEIAVGGPGVDPVEPFVHATAIRTSTLRDAVDAFRSFSA